MKDPYLPSYALNGEQTVAVSTEVYWKHINSAPRGVKVQLLGRGGVATYGTYYGDPFWTHWCPLPKLEKPSSVQKIDPNKWAFENGLEST